MSQFTVRGKFQTRDGMSPFETTIEAENEDLAREHTLSNFGSKHNLKRTQIEIEEVKAQ
ncbi:50S ribosomal protein L18Ae [Haloarchaeobius sp. TZWWS8]|uniref:50S ribosomal protein L18Ae n=1 Tax=Haloarchaeobius sp. TZWWS8 TaxID=3446121 RepID=UPI003EBF15EA